jgi:hypothetical protein
MADRARPGFTVEHPSHEIHVALSHLLRFQGLACRPTIRQGSAPMRCKVPREHADHSFPDPAFHQQGRSMTVEAWEPMVDAEVMRAQQDTTAAPG